MPIKLNSTGGGSVTIDVPSTASTYTLTAPARTGNIITSGDTGTITQGMLAGGVAGNGPAFAVGAGTPFAVASSTIIKATFGTETFDTASCYENNRFTPNVAGYYHISAGVQYHGTSSSAFSLIRIYKNGSLLVEGNVFASVVYASPVVSHLVYLNGSTDYVEIYMRHDAGSTQNMGGKFFSGFLARAA